LSLQFHTHLSSSLLYNSLDSPQRYPVPFSSTTIHNYIQKLQTQWL
jgi:hypothetical protein